MSDIEKLLKEGFSVNGGVTLESLLVYSISANAWGSVIYRNQLEILARLRGEEIDPAELDRQVAAAADDIADHATKVKNDWIARHAK